MENKQILMVIGMAGSGKTTFCQRLYSWISAYTTNKLNRDAKSIMDIETGLNKFIYSINLDPAVLNAKMPLNEDIRDSLDIQDVMDKYNLGPNGAIITSLNLYLLKVDELIEKIKSKEPSFIIIDTPGQIEAFTWSSPGFVLVESLKILEGYSMNVLYVIDSDMCSKPAVFISNMVYAASLAYKNKLMFWLKDYNNFRESLNDDEMYSPMLSSLALYYEEFYSYLESCFISSLTGNGRNDFFQLVGIENNSENLNELTKNVYKDEEEEIVEKIDNLNIDDKK